jgi:serine phosphatase RsbU (regulator of sigma subunit)/anti-sigma regulatory factor (Ser/Thr protein kinase)
MRSIVTSTTVALIAGAVLTVGAVSERNSRRALTREIEARLLLEARNLSLASAGALLSDYPELTLVPVVKQMQEDRPELAFVAVTDHNNAIQGHAEARRLGETFQPPAGLVPVHSGLKLGPGERLLGNGELLVVETTVSHPSRPDLGHAWVALRRAYLDAAVASARREQFVFLVALLGIGVVLAGVVMSWLLRPIGALRAGLERVGQGDLDTPVKLTDRTELGLLADAMNDMAGRLKVAQKESAERERLTREVELARTIQQRLLPAGRRVLGDHVVQGAHRAAAEVGGDYYDVTMLRNGRAALAIADVSGKGLGGCLVMSMVSALLRPLREVHSSPSALLVELENHLVESLHPGEFVTMFYGLLDPFSGRFVYASAGHTPLLVYRGRDARIEWQATSGIPLGAVRGGALKATLEDRVVELGPGDLLLQFTDGLSEAFDAQGEAFGFERIEDVVREHAASGADALLAALSGKVQQWNGGRTPQDDETMLVLERTGDRARNGHDVRGLGEADPLELFAEAETAGVELSFPAHFDRLTELHAWLARCPDLQRLDAETLIKIETALYEACANVVEHGLQGDDTKSFTLWWVPAGVGGSPARDARVRRGYFVLRDRGFPFSPGRWQRADLQDPKVWQRGRGLGLDIIHLTMSEVVYRPATEVGNLMFMSFDPARSGASQETQHG